MDTIVSDFCSNSVKRCLKWYTNNKIKMKVIPMLRKKKLSMKLNNPAIVNAIP